MCNKSLALRPCDQNALCGISVRFHTLFHTHRQIAHALLTRPPLTVLLLFVRLECVKHAASVHPEPGSNSLKNYILNTLGLPQALSISFRAIVLASLLTFRVLNVFSY